MHLQTKYVVTDPCLKKSKEAYFMLTRLEHLSSQAFICLSCCSDTWTVQSRYPWGSCCHLSHHHSVSKLLTAAHLQKSQTETCSSWKFLLFPESRQMFKEKNRGLIIKEDGLNRKKSFSLLLIQWASSAVTLQESWQGPTQCGSVYWGGIKLISKC